MHIKSPRFVGALARAGIAAILLLPIAGLTAMPAAATINGAGCSAQAADSSGKAVPPSISINDTATWNVSKDSHLSGTGKAPGDQTFGYAYAMAFGFGVIPIAGGKGKGSTGAGSLDVASYSKYARVFPGYGASDDCSGSLVVVVQDEAVLDTLAGQASIGLIVIGLLGLFGVIFRRGS